MNGNLVTPTPDLYVCNCTLPEFWNVPFHYNDVIMSLIASQITSLTIVYSTVYSDADQRKHQSSASLAFVRGIHRGPVNSPHKGPVKRKMFPFDDVIMCLPLRLCVASWVTMVVRSDLGLTMARAQVLSIWTSCTVRAMRPCWPCVSMPPGAAMIVYIVKMRQWSAVSTVWERWCDVILRYKNVRVL